MDRRPGEGTRGHLSKIAEAVIWGRPKIEIWGDGRQARSFTHIDDCLTGTLLVTESDFYDPLNVGSSELVTVDQLVSLVEEIAGVHLERKYDPSAPKGVNGRNSDNTLIQSVLGWEPSISLREGLETTYSWVYDQVNAAANGSPKTSDAKAAAGSASR